MIWIVGAIGAGSVEGRNGAGRVRAILARQGAIRGSPTVRRSVNVVEVEVVAATCGAVNKSSVYQGHAWSTLGVARVRHDLVSIASSSMVLMKYTFSYCYHSIISYIHTTATVDATCPCCLCILAYL